MPCMSPRTVRIGEVQAKGYYEEDAKEVFERYMSPADLKKTAQVENALPTLESDEPSAGGPEKTPQEQEKKDGKGATGGEAEAA